MSSSKVTYRMFRREEDLPGVLKLWAGASGWGGISEEDFDTWYMNTPHGESVISVAIDEKGEIFAQAVFFPMRTLVNGREVKSLHLSAPILDTSQRSTLSTTEHPLLGVYKAAEQEALKLGYEILFATPQKGWLPVFRWASRLGLIRFDRIKYGCASRPVLGQLPEAGGAALEARVATSLGDDFDVLWTQAAESFPMRCANVRDSKWVAWRNGAHRIVESRDADGQLAGYASVRADGLVVDVLARRPDELSPVIEATIRNLRAAADAGEEGLPRDIKLMRHAKLEPAIEALAFEDVDFEFAFSSNAIGPNVGRAEAAPENWYVMPLY